MAAKKMKNTLVELEMADGTTVKLTLAYRFLIQLSGVNRKVYDEYNAIWNKKDGKREEIDNVKMLYAAYLCAQIQEGTVDTALSWDEFIDNLTLDREETGRAITALIAPKRVRGTATHSE